MVTVHETYAAALQHGKAELPAGTRLVGVVRRPMGWFHGAVDENVPVLGPPDDLLDAVKDRQAALEETGLDDTDAIEQAWADTDFSDRYVAYLDGDPDAEAAMTDLVNRIRSGTDIALVCYEAPDKPCHRHLLLERLPERLEGG